jgi:hypothetical protein
MTSGAELGRILKQAYLRTFIIQWQLRIAEIGYCDEVGRVGC